LRLSSFGLRGFAGESLTPEVVIDFAAAFGTFLDGGSVLVGRDTRLSSPMVHAGVVAGLQSAGCEVLDLGICPTPVVQFTVPLRQAAGVIAISGGHMRPGWNALKFIGRDGLFLGRARAEELFDIHHQGQFDLVPEEALPAAEPVAEGNGGVIVPAVHPGRDSYIAMALVLELLVKERCTLSQARDAVPRYALLKKKLPMRPKHVPDALRRLRRHYAGQRVNLLDGVFVDYPDAWVHVRPSNTEPILRLVAEAPTAEAATRLLDEARAVLAPTADSPQPLVGGRADGQGQR
jgi:phosphomannomutase